MSDRDEEILDKLIDASAASAGVADRAGLEARHQGVISR